MPRNGSGVYNLPPGTPGISGTPVESEPYNTLIADLEFDLNYPRPIVAGGTGASTPAAALDNLGGYPDTGGVLTGNIEIRKNTPALILTATAVEQSRPIAGYLNDKPRWSLAIGDGTAESGSNAGSDFSLSRFADNGDLIDTPVKVTRDAGTLVINTISAQLILDKIAGTAANSNFIVGRTNHVHRWIISPGNATAETGGNTGSDFAIHRYADDGAFVGTPFTIDRKTGVVMLSPSNEISRIDEGTLRLGGGALSTGGYTGGRLVFQGHSGFTHYGIDTEQGKLRFYQMAGGTGYNKAQFLTDVDIGGSLGATGAIVAGGEVWAASGTANTGIYRFGNGGSAYIWCDGTQYTFGTHQITVPAIGCAGSIVAQSNIQAVGGLFCGGAYGVGAVGYSGSAPYAVNLISGNPNWGNCYLQLLHYGGVWAGFRVGIPGTYFDLRGDGQAYKQGGGPWADISDARIKNVLGDYGSGLDAIAALRPVRYTFKGNDTYAEPSYYSDSEKLDADGEPKAPPSGKTALAAPYANSTHYQAAIEQKEFIGLIAQEVEAAMPEMVKQGKGYIDGVAVTDLRDLDTTPLIFALINSIKELKARVEALEAAG